MEREATVLVLGLAWCGPLLLVGSALARPVSQIAPSGRCAERSAWRRVWLPLLPATFALLLAIGWALQAPDETDDVLSPIMLVVALPGALVAARAVARALRSMWMRATPLAGTIGLIRPRIAIDAVLTRILDDDELDAVRAHELAHARHRDPFRIWLGQLVTDLQWPAPSAATRFRLWLHTLELARDEEARESGVEGESLAAAVVNVTRLAQRRCGIVAGLVGDGELLRDRISRLLRPLVGTERARRAALGVIGVLLAGALVIGAVGGDAVLRQLPGVTAAL